MPFFCIFTHFLVLICLGLRVRLYYFLHFLHVWRHRSSALNILYGDRVNIDPGVNTIATRPKWEAKLLHSFTTTQRSLRFIGWQPEISEIFFNKDLKGDQPIMSGSVIRLFGVTEKIFFWSTVRQLVQKMEKTR